MEISFPKESAAGEVRPPLGLSGLQDLIALLPVAGAELVGLQSVEHAQDLLRVAADAEVVHGDEANDPFGIDDEGSAQRYTLSRVEDAERGAELAPDVR